MKTTDDTKTTVAKIYTAGPFAVRLTGPNVRALSKKVTKIGESFKMSDGEKDIAYETEITKVVLPKVRLVDANMKDDPEASLAALFNHVKALVPLENPNAKLDDFGIEVDE